MPSSSSSSIPLSAIAEQVDDMGLWLPLEFLGDDMFGAAAEHQIPPAMGFSGGARSPFAGFAPDLSFSGDWKKGFSTANLSGTTSPDGPSLIPSPSSTPSVQSGDEVLDLIYAVADEIAGIRLHEQQQWLPNPAKHAAAAAQRFASAPSFAGTGYYASTTTHASALQQLQFHRLRQEQQIKQQQQQMQMSGGWGKQNRDRIFGDDRVCDSALGLPSPAWPPLNGRHHGHQPPQQHHHQHPAAAGMTAIFLNAPRKGSAGTGVFLPKRAGNGAPSEPRKKSGYSTVLVPARVVQALNINLDELGVYPRYPGGDVVDHDSLLLARRSNAGVAPSFRGGQKHSFRPNAAVAGDEIQLPPEWTY